MLRHLQRFYRSISKQILFATSFSSFELFPSLTKALRLKPDGYDKHPKVWVDEFSSKVFLSDGKIDISFPGISAKSKSTDLYRNRTPQYHLQNGRSALIGISETNDFIISILGRDDVVRTFAFKADKLRVVSSLHLGIPLLTILLSKTSQTFLKVDFDVLDGYDFYLVRLPVVAAFRDNTMENKRLFDILG